KITTAAYVPGARSGLWDSFVERTLPNEEVRDYVQRIAGSSLVGNPVDQRFYLVQGPGATGKSTFLNTLCDVLGDYGTEINPDTLLARKGDPVVRNDLARLVGMRYVMAVEPPKDKSWDISTIKAMTGGDPIVARYLYHEPFSFKPQFVLLVGVNDMPSASADDGAFWRRARRVVFDMVVPEDQRDRDLPQKLKAPEARSGV